MKNNNIQLYGPIVIVSFATFLAYFITNTYAAEPKPTAADYANLEDIRNNQRVIEETREAHERFMQAKEWNEAETDALAKNGWCPKWSEKPHEITLEHCPLE